MKRWYLLYCKKGELSRAKMHLENQGVACYYPEIEVDKIIRGKRSKVTEPLFSSYMFICFDYTQGPAFTTIRSTRGVADFVRVGRYPREIEEELIDSLRECEKVTQGQIASELPEKGQKVRIAQGQFAGLDAIYKEPDGEVRSILLINMLNKVVPVRIDNKDLDL